MVSANLRQSLDGISDAIRDREYQAIAAFGILFAGGIVAGQAFSDRVLPMINRPIDPSNPTDLGIAALVKVFGAAVVAAVGAATGGLGALLAGGLAGGMLGLAGADAFNMLTTNGGVLGGQARPRRQMHAGRGGGSPSPRRSPSAASAGSSASGASASSGGQARQTVDF